MQATIEENVTLVYNKFINKKTKPLIYVCQHPGCGRKYDNITSLTRHLARHNPEKNYICDTCGKAFLRSSELEMHTRVHTGIKPFKCDICDKTFARITDLRIHLIYHSDKKPFACPFPGCHHAYKRKSDCKKHIRQHLQNNQNDISPVFQKVSSAFHPVPLNRIKVTGNSLCFFDN